MSEWLCQYRVQDNTARDKEEHFTMKNGSLIRTTTNVHAPKKSFKIHKELTEFKKTMEKTYTLGELLESPKGQEMLDENLDAHVDVDVVEAILELDY